MIFPGEKIKLIIADDSAEFLEGLEVLLSTMDKYLIIDRVANGNELINSPYLYEADIILTDIEMPVMNGIEAAKHINFKNPSTLIIALTMYFDKVYLEDIVAAGFKAFIYKPTITSSLFDTIEKVLNNEYIFPDNLRLHE